MFELKHITKTFGRETALRDVSLSITGGMHYILGASGPLGAIYSLFNPVSVLRYRVDMEKCVHCGACANVCKMGCDPVKNANSLECIRCGTCKNICPAHAIEYTVFSKPLHKKSGKKNCKIPETPGAQ